MPNEPQINIGDAWKDVDGLQINIGDAWKEVDAIQVNIGDAWKEAYKAGVPPPANMLVLYTSSGDYSGIPGASRYSSGDVRFPKSATSSLGGTGGNSTHNASSHGAGLNNGQVIDSQHTKIVHTSAEDFATDINDHTHTVPSTHSHTGTGTNIPKYVDFIPVTGGEYIGANAWIPSIASIVHALLAYDATYDGRHIRLNASLATGGADTHTHAAVTGELNDFTTGHEETVSDTSPITWYHYHDHVYDHTHAADGHVYQWYGMRMMKASGDIFDFDSLPSNTAGIFTSASLPSGWSNVSGSVGRMLRCNATGGATGGNGTTHTIVLSAGMNSGVQQDKGVNHQGWDSASGQAWAPAVNHVHAINHGHLTGVSHQPPYINLYIGKKD
jgi:hypothetical protein